MKKVVLLLLAISISALIYLIIDENRTTNNEYITNFKTEHPAFIIIIALSFILNGYYFGKELLYKIGAATYIVPFIVTVGFYYYYIGASESLGIPLTKLSIIFWEYVPFE